MRVALLLFGQLRDIETPVVYESHKREIIDKYKTDVFCQYWWSSELTTYPVSNWAATRPTSAPVPKNAPEIIQERYNPVGTLCEKPRTFENTARLCEIIAAGYKSSKHALPHWVRPQIVHNMQSQLCAIESVVNFFETTANPADYDFVVVSRYDLILRGIPDLARVPCDRITLMGCHPRFPDLVFIVPPTMLATQKTFSNMEQIIEECMPRLGSVDFWEPSVECIKFQQFLRCGYTRANLHPVVSIYGDRVSGR